MRILVVEDDRLLNTTLCYNLSTAGYDVDVRCRLCLSSVAVGVHVRASVFSNRKQTGPVLWTALFCCWPWVHGAFSGLYTAETCPVFRCPM